MRQRELREVLPALNRRCDTFHYSKDSYCLQLLRYRYGQQARISQIKRGPMRSLLEKPAMRALSARQGDGRLDLDGAAVAGADEFEFRLTYSLWRGHHCWDQVSRFGWQLVVQLNFSAAHDQLYRNKVRPKGSGPFAFTSHPVRTRGMQTLAWARIDLDPVCGEALIEEVQNDWLRECRRFAQEAGTCKGRSELRRWMKHDHLPDTTIGGVMDYILNHVAPYESVWQEALLSACLKLLVEELGYRRIYMHSWDTGRVLKHCHPPRSLYSRLPRRFCMQQVRYGPGMLRVERRARRALRHLDDPYWFRHRFEGDHHGYA